MFSDYQYRPSSLASIYHMLGSKSKAVEPKESPQVEKAPVREPVAEVAVVKPKKVKPVAAPIVAPKEVEAPVAEVRVAKPKKIKPEPEPPAVEAKKVEVKVKEKPTEKPVAASSRADDTPEPAPRLRVIHQLLTKTDGAPKAKRVTAMSELWREAQSKGIKGFNKMKKVDLENMLRSTK